MKRFAIAAAWAVCGYLAGAFGGGFLINALSSNQHDRSIEAAMTGAFVTGPLGAVIAFVVGFVRFGRTSRRSRELSLFARAPRIEGEARLQ